VEPLAEHQPSVGTLLSSHADTAQDADWKEDDGQENRTAAKMGGEATTLKH